MPTYTKPVIELVAEDIAEVLEGVTRENGYHADIASVERLSRIGNTPLNGKAYLIQDIPRRVDNPALGHEEWWLPFAIWAFVIDSDTTTVPIEARLNVIRSDIESALLDDTIRNSFPGYQRSGYAIDTLTQQPDYVEDLEGQLIGVIAKVECHIRTLYGDPFSI